MSEPGNPVVQPTNIIISHVYSSDNKGDAALTSVLIKDLKLKFPKAKITILKLEANPANELFDGVPQMQNFMHHALNKYRSPLPKLIYTLYLTSATLSWATWLRLTGKQLYLPADLRDVARKYAKADLVVAVGGGYLRSRNGIMHRLNVPLLLHPLLFGRILRKPTVLYPQSVGPFMHALEKPMVSYVLKRMDLIIIREDTSVELLRQMGVAKNVVRSVDSGFLLKSTSRANIHKNYKLPANKLILGVTVRAWLSKDAQIKYEIAVAAALDKVTKEFNAHILFIPQVTASKGDDDRVVGKRVRNYMSLPKSATLINDNLDHLQIKAIYDELDVLLGTRFHSVIFSLTSYVPVLAIEYEHKTSGIMADLGLENWVMKIEDISEPKLTKNLIRLIRRRAQYKSYLEKHIPAYVNKATQTADMLEKVFRRA